MTDTFDSEWATQTIEDSHYDNDLPIFDVAVEAVHEVERLRSENAMLQEALSALVLHLDAVVDFDEWQGATDAIEKARALLAKKA